jgi:hypothetical protein
MRCILHTEEEGQIAADAIRGTLALLDQGRSANKPRD